MSDRVFDPQKSPDTLSTVMAHLLAKWSALPAATQQALDSRRHLLADELAALKDYQRPLKIIEFLTWLETLPTVATVAAAALQAGKDLPRRSGFVRIDDMRLQHLTAALAAPLPVAAGQTARPVVEVSFFVRMEFPAKVAPNVQTPLIVQLTQAEPPANQNAGQVVLAFADLQIPMPVTVTLTAPDFGEQTGHWTRTILVESGADSWPAVFLLAANATLGDTKLTLDFANALGQTVRPVTIAAQSKDPLRSAEPQAAFRPDSADVEYFTHLAFPGQIRPLDEQPLIVQLTLAEMAESIAAGRAKFHFADLRKPEFVEVVVTAPGLQEPTGSWRRLLMLYGQSDSQPAVFLLKAGADEGSQPVTVDFYHRNRLVLATGFSTEVTKKPAALPLPIQMKPGSSQIEPLPAQPPPPPDLELRIVFDAQTNTLTFKLHSPLPALGYQRRDLGSVRLHSNPRQFLERKLATLNQSARLTAEQLSPADLQLVSDEIQTIGQELFEELFPPELRQEYWRIKTLRETGTIKTLQLISDEPWIPWELVKPYSFDAEKNVEQSDGYLAEVFQMCRWLAGRGPAPGVQVNEASLVSSQSDLPSVEQEEQYFVGLKEHGITVHEPLRTRAAVLQLTKSGTTQLLHLAAHGNFDAQNADDSELILDDEPLRPSDLSGERSAALRRQRPLVFLNICHGAQADFNLTGLGGWADKLIGTIGVSAFVGALWEINDELAAEFAMHFYDNLIAGQTFSAACHAARLAIREQQPANPTWLAYTLYADPNAKVTFGTK